MWLVFDDRNDAIPLRRRSRILELATGRLQDKSGNVRKRAIHLITLFVTRHPFKKDGMQLNLGFFQQRLEATEKELQSYIDLHGAVPNLDKSPEKAPSPDKAAGKKGSKKLSYSDSEGEDESQSQSQNQSLEDDQSSSSALNESSDKSQTAEPAPVEVLHEAAAKAGMLMVERKYYSDAIAFVTKVQEGMVSLSQLLASTTKGDVMEAIDFFTTASQFNIEGTEDGIRKMVHLIWTKDDGSEEGKGVKQRLFQAYTDLYFTADPALSKADKAKQIVKNLFKLTENVTLAELTSLDELMSCMMEKGFVSQDIINTLWIYFGLCFFFFSFFFFLFLFFPVVAKQVFAQKNNNNKRHCEVRCLTFRQTGGGHAFGNAGQVKPRHREGEARHPGEDWAGTSRQARPPPRQVLVHCAAGTL